MEKSKIRTAERIQRVLRDMDIIIKDEQYDEVFEDLGIDSLTLIKILVELEKEFGVEVCDEFLSFDRLGSVNKLMAFFNLE